MWGLIGVITWLKSREGESIGTEDEDLYDGMFLKRAGRFREAGLGSA